MRSTAKILDRLHGEASAEVAEPTTLLGDWYANMVFSKPQQMVLCMSERTLLPIVVTARDLHRFSERLCVNLAEMLHSIGVPALDVDAELSEMDSFALTGTLSKSTLASMNGLMRDLKWSLQYCPERSPVEHAQYVASFPRKALGFALPTEATLAAFKDAARGHGVC